MRKFKIKTTPGVLSRAHMTSMDITTNHIFSFEYGFESEKWFANKIVDLSSHSITKAEQWLSAIQAMLYQSTMCLRGV